MTICVADYTSAARILYGNVTGIGYIGVTLFFVLSGFLITGILLRTKKSPHYLKSFFIRRALRILPLYYFTVFMFFDVGLPLATRFAPNNNSVRAWTAYGPAEQLLYWFHVSNWRSAFGALVASPVGHFWSLACEEQFYFIWPWVVLLLGETSLLILCVVITFLCISVRFVPAFQLFALTHPDIGRLTFFSFEPLLLGAILAISFRHPKAITMISSWVPFSFFAGTACLVAAGCLGRSTILVTPAMMTLGSIGIDIAFFSAVGYAAAQSGASSIPARILRSPFLTKCGKYSYAMYVFQTPVRYVLLIPPIRQRIDSLGGNWVPSLLSIAFGIAVSYTLALGAWNLIERPFLQLKARFAA